MNDPVHHPVHYSDDGVGFECIELARRATFDVGNAIKYMWRTDRKNGRQDIEKARWYVNDAIESRDLCCTSVGLVGRTEFRDLCFRVADSGHRYADFFRAIGNFDLDRALIVLDFELHGPLYA